MHIVCKGNGQNNTKGDVEIHAFSFTNFVCERSLEEAGAGQFVYTLKIALATVNGRRRRRPSRYQT